MTYSVAIDGPSGAGKSTLSKEISKELGFLYVDTGAIYRTVGWDIFCHGIDPTDAAGVALRLPALQISMCYAEDGSQHMLLGEEDVSEQIRLPQISLYASTVSRHPAVRAFLLEQQREFARRNHVVMDGRDIGTVVLPDAQVKIFLTASAEERARRRHKELIERGTACSFEQVLRDLRERDWQDTHREQAPLRPAEDSVLVDTTEMDFAQSKQRLLTLIKERLEQ